MSSSSSPSSSSPTLSDLSVLSSSSSSKIAYLNFVNGLKSKETKITFSKLLFKYLDHLGLTKENLADLLMNDVKILQNDLISYIIKLKDEGYSYASMDLRLTAINTFFSMNDIIVNKKRISRYLGEHIKTVKDRAYTIEEIKRMVDASDIKFKFPVVYTILKYSFLYSIGIGKKFIIRDVIIFILTIIIITINNNNNNNTTISTI
jgi:hypothetical protein